METQLTDAVLLLFIGMVTVFIILFLVTMSGNLLIKAINKMEDISNPATIRNRIPSNVVAIATAIVAEITDGQGVIDRIERR